MDDSVDLFDGLTAYQRDCDGKPISVVNYTNPHAPSHGVMGGSNIVAGTGKALEDMKNAFGSLNMFGNTAPKPSNNGHPAKKTGGPGPGKG